MPKTIRNVYDKAVSHNNIMGGIFMDNTKIRNYQIVIAIFVCILGILYYILHMSFLVKIFL